MTIVRAAKVCSLADSDSTTPILSLDLGSGLRLLVRCHSKNCDLNFVSQHLHLHPAQVHAALVNMILSRDKAGQKLPHRADEQADRITTISLPPQTT